MQEPALLIDITVLLRAYLGWFRPGLAVVLQRSPGCRRIVTFLRVAAGYALAKTVGYAFFADAHRSNVTILDRQLHLNVMSEGVRLTFEGGCYTFSHEPSPRLQ